ncbi:MAG: trigger factor [Bacillota bacterium]|nr:trigger factor [Bacillota bacterium]
MKKKISILALALISIAGILVLGGCGEGDNPYDGMDLGEYIKVGQYKGIEVKKIDAKVTPQQMGDAIREAQQAAETSVELKKGDVIKEGDVVNINYVGRLDGKKFDGGSAKDYNLTIGSGTFIDGFEEGLVGHEVGEKGIKLNLAFPLNYQSEDLAGKDVVFTVKINSASRMVKPEYDLDFVKTQGDFKSLEEYEKALKKELYKQNKAEADQEIQNQVWSQVLENTKVKKYPKDMVQHYIDNYNDQMDYIAEQNGTTKEMIMEQYYGITSDDVLQKQFKESARLLVKQEMLIEYIAEIEGITYTDEEAEELRNSIEAQGYDDEQVEQETGRTLDQYVRIELLFEKVKEFLVKEAVIK